MNSLDERKKLIFEKIKRFFVETEPLKPGSLPSQEDSVNKKLEDFFKKFNIGQSNWFYWLSLIPILLLGWYVRTRNLPYLAGKYLIELDSYFFYRYAKTILETGTLPVIDYMRYVPLGYTTIPYKFFPLTLARMYEFISVFFPHVTQLQWHVVYPPVITIISFVFFFLFVKELVNYKTALVSTAFLAVIPAYIQRTSAGFADHEAMAMLWMFISLWFFILMWKSNSYWNSVVFGVLSGFFTGFMALTWGGFRFVTLIVSLFIIMTILFKLPKVQTVFGYSLWSVITLIFISRLYFGSSLLDFLKNPDNILVIFSLLTLVIYFLPVSNIISLKLKWCSKGLASFLISIALFFVPAYFLGYVRSSLIKGTLDPHFQRWGATVSESQQPTFFGGGGWSDSYGLIIWFAILVAAAVLYKIFEVKSAGSLLSKLKQNKFSVLSLLVYFIFILSYVQSRSGKFSFGASFFSRTYAFWIIISLMLLFFIYIFAQMKEEFFLQDKAFLLLIFVFIIATLILSRYMVRLLFAFAPPAALASGLFITKIIDKFSEFKNKLPAILFSVLVIFLFYSTAGNAIDTNKYMGSMVPGQWEAAITFLREQTPKDSVVAHWWDYGHLTTALGERAAVTDGGNVRSWNYQSSRYFLTGKDRISTLEYLKTHNVTHILISKDEIPKYPAFSLIGSDVNFDRYSSVGIFGFQQEREVRDGVMLLYSGSWPFDKDFMQGNIILPANQAGVGGFSIIVGANETLLSPTAYVSYNNQQYQFAVNCMYLNGNKLNFEPTGGLPEIKGCVVLAPHIRDQTQANPVGTLFWLPEKIWDTNFARLYMYNEQDSDFKLVYSDDAPLGLYQGQIIGPIKIWEVQYAPDIKSDAKYLENDPF